MKVMVNNNDKSGQVRSGQDMERDVSKTVVEDVH